MQIKRGLFRLWLVLSLAWAAFCLSIMLESVVIAFKRQPLYQQEVAARQVTEPTVPNQTRAPRRLSELLAEPEDPRPWGKLGEMLGFVLGVPLTILAFGAALSWAVSGFRSGP